MIPGLYEKIMTGGRLSRNEALSLVSIEGTELFELFLGASRLRERFRGKDIELCSIINAKSGACPEDCAYCAQASKSITNTPVYPLIREDDVIGKATEAREAGVKRFCIVTGGRKVSKRELLEIASMIRKVRELGLLPCATLGLLNRDELSVLKDAGLERYHHNLETSERFFPEVCTTHTYRDKLDTIEAVKYNNLSLCSAGIFGIGETWQDRIDMAFKLRELEVDSVPINFLIPVEGTPLGCRDILHPFDALKIISIYRFILPDNEIRVCGGRRQALREMNSMVFMAGADALLTGNYLTTTGMTFEDDLRLIRDYGLNAGLAETRNSEAVQA